MAQPIPDGKGLCVKNVRQECASKVCFNRWGGGASVSVVASAIRQHVADHTGIIICCGPLMLQTHKNH